MGNRTPDLFIANEPLYQLSYVPVASAGGFLQAPAPKTRGQAGRLSIGTKSVTVEPV